MAKEIPTNRVDVLDCRQGAVRAVRHSADGHYCLTSGSDKTIKLWNPSRKLPLKTYSGHGYEVLDARGSCDNAHIVSGSMDRTVAVWEVGSGLAVRKYRGHAASVNCVRFNEDSSLAISGSVDGRVKCWDVKSKRQDPVQTLEECKDSVTSLDVSDHEILVGCADCKVRRYDLRNGQLLTDFVGSPVASVTFTRDGQCLLVAGSNGDPVRLFDKSTGEMLQEYSGHVNSKYRVEALLDRTDRLVLSGSEDGSVHVWDLVEGTRLGKLDHSHKTQTALGEVSISAVTVHSLSFHPDKCELLTAARGSFYVWRGDSAMEDSGQEETT